MNGNEKQKTDVAEDLPIRKSRTDVAIALASQYEAWRTTFSKLTGEVQKLQSELDQAKKVRQHAQEERDKAHEKVQRYIHEGMYEPEVYISARSAAFNRPEGDEG